MANGGVAAVDQNPYVERYGMEVVGVLANKDGKELTLAGEVYNSTIGI